MSHYKPFTGEEINWNDVGPGLIIHETFNGNSALLEFDTEKIVSNIPEISQARIGEILYEISKNILRMQTWVVHEKGNI
jgi:hypothetical protein